jgi:signal peptidase I
MNFALILFVATVATGVIALADKLYFARHRAPDAREPWWIEYPKSSGAPDVSLLRSFVAEPFKIPSSSMRPTLESRRFHPRQHSSPTGCDCRSSSRRWSRWPTPLRGDVVVFRYPPIRLRISSSA